MYRQFLNNDPERRTGIVELFLVLLAAGILIKLLRAVFRLLSPSAVQSKRRDQGSEKLPAPDSQASWFGTEAGPSFQGFSIPGLVYYGGMLRDYSGENDACLINPHLQLSEKEESQPLSIKNISYSALSPRQRFGYLQWLSQGREEPDCELWCVLLFLYGLERRLFIDGPRGRVTPEERKSIVLEVLRLLQIYGEKTILRRYFINMLAMEWGIFGDGAEIPPYLYSPGISGKEIFPAISARLADRGLPLPGETALQWLIHRPEGNIPPTARKHPELFRQLFLLRYSQKFEKGIPLHPGRTPLILEYQGANPSLGGILRIRVSNLQNPFVIRTPLQKIAALGEACAEELEPYSHKLHELKGRENTDARALLPQDLLPFLPEGDAIRLELSKLCVSGPALVRLRLLERILGNEPPQERRGGYRRLRKRTAALGFNLVPENGCAALALCEDPFIVLYEGTAIPEPPKEILLLEALLRLGTLVAQALGNVSPAKEEVFRALFRRDEKQSQEEKESLQALLLWFFRTPQSSREIRSVLKDFSQEGKGAMGRVLLTLAMADGAIDKEEMIQLEKLFNYLGLEKKRLPVVPAALSFGAEPSADEEGRESAVRVFESELILLRQEDSGEIQKILAGTFESSEEETWAEIKTIEDDREDLFPDC